MRVTMKPTLMGSAQPNSGLADSQSFQRTIEVWGVWSIVGGMAEPDDRVGLHYSQAACQQAIDELEKER